MRTRKNLTIKKYATVTKVNRILRWIGAYAGGGSSYKANISEIFDTGMLCIMLRNIPSLTLFCVIRISGAAGLE
jgi:hypothetical protein